MKFSEKIPSLVRLGRFLWKWTKRSARPVFFTLVCLVTLVALLIAEENYRTGKEWENYQAAAKARGVKFSLAELAPPPVPDDQNFVMTPLLKPLYSEHSEDYSEQLSKKLRLRDIPTSDQSWPELGDWTSGKLTDLAKWAANYHGQDVLSALKKHDADLAEISAAIRRPYSRLPVPYDRPSAIFNGGIFWLNFLAINDFSALYELRGVAELAAGQNEAALTDAITLLRLSQATRDELFFTSKLSEPNTLSSDSPGALQIAWEGLAARSWTDSQLAELQQEIQKIDLLSQLVSAERGDRAYFTSTLELFAQQDGAARKKMFNNMGSWAKYNLNWRVELFEWLQLQPFSLNRYLLAGNEYFDQYVQSAINLPERRFYPELIQAGEEKIWKDFDKYDSRNHPNERNLIIHLLPDPNGMLMPKFAHAQASLDEAAVACALERFRLAHGNFPEKLNELMPQYIAQLPHDLLTGGPLHYQRTNDGNFILSSTGWGWKYSNKASEQGIPTIVNTTWVWRYPAK